MARRRRRQQEEHTNHERWLVSYADFITLLFAFFVVMYAISSVNEGKYRVLSQSLVAAFRSPPKSLEPIQFGSVEESRPTVSKPFEGFPAPLQVRGMPQAIASDVPPPQPAAQTATPAAVEIQKMGQMIRRRLASLITTGTVSVQVHPNWIDIKLNSDILFSSASITLEPSATSVIKSVSQALRTLPVQIQVEGFTDNVPIHSAEFPSNWELSAARAASVVRLMVANGMVPQKLAAVGYGEYHPLTSNATPQGRAQNRRVELVVVARNTPIPSRMLSAPERAVGG